MIAAGIVLVVLLLISQLRVSIVAVYDTDGFTVDGGIAFVRLRVYPPPKKKKKRVKKKAEKKAEKPGRLATLRGQLPAIAQAFLKLKKRLCINELTIYYLAAGGTDPAAAALSFGGASAGYGFILPLLENNFKIKKRDLRAAVDFTATEPYVYVKAKLSLAVWEAPAIVIGLVRAMAKSDRKAIKIRKAV